MIRLVRALAPALLLLGLLAIWEVACRALHVKPYFLPPPSAVLAAAIADPWTLLVSAWKTLQMALLALLTVSLIGTGLALAVAGSQTLERAARPLAVTIQVTPIIAIAPLALIWAGIDHAGRAIIGLAAVVAFFPIFSGALTGLKSADPDLERLFDLYGATPAQRLWRLRLPAAVPFILEGHKVAAGQAVVGAVVAEYVAQSGAAQGLAWRIMEASQRLQTARMIAAIFALGLLGAAVFGLMRTLETLALKWWRGR
jgi:NitT/TauT family transport system permease protein